MDVFEFQSWLDKITEPFCTDYERDIHFRYIMELCRERDLPLDISLGLLHTAYAMMLANNDEKATSEFISELRIVASAAETAGNRMNIRSRTKAIASES
ncbi:hypothetical protein [Pelagovum pacificum]|uniref:hypothetical protein n=1 Tax=Pelagovum pacificum TaxID=2588711 RepID=UPI00111CD1C9|nr:hypothetical protein [Pelagovum pacificum]QQA45104.1 hypothetical protein I8N54_20055 [Pelagovum pacificum]